MPSTQVRWADLTDPNAVGQLLREVSPSAIIHLAAIIPPACYARPALARRVNVDATGYLVDAAVALPGDDLAVGRKVQPEEGLSMRIASK